MKTFTFFLLCIIFALMIPRNTLAADATISGNIVRKVTTTTTSASIPIRDCSGATTGTIPGITNSVDAFPAYTAFTTVTIKIYAKDTSGSPIQTIPSLSKTDIGFNTSTGAFSYSVTGIAASRYSYVAKVCLDAEVNSSYVREFTISTGGAIFPIGSVIAYMANASTVAGLEASGWYKCDGRGISTLTASLSGDEISAFVNVVGSSLPDLRGMFLRGLDESRLFDDNAGSRTGGESTTGVRSYQGCEIQAHGHTGTAAAGGNHDHGGSTGNASRQYSHSTTSNILDGGSSILSDNSFNDNHTHTIPASGNHTHTLTIDNAGGLETRPENTAVYYIIRGR